LKVDNALEVGEINENSDQNSLVFVAGTSQQTAGGRTIARETSVRKATTTGKNKTPHHLTRKLLQKRPAPTTTESLLGVQ
jgi:hypothetical protein